MTGRELIAAVRPMEQYAKAVMRFAEIAQEAIKLEAGLGLATAQLQETRTTLASTRAEVERLQQQRQGLETDLAASRAAGEQEIATHLAHWLAEAEAAASASRAEAIRWTEQAKQAEADYTHRVARLKADETALAAHVGGLRELAQRMAKAAEAVPR